jgi:hypothetical protein
MKFFGLFLCLCASLCPAQTPSRAERGRKIVDEALAALGGDKFLAMRDRTESGRAYSFYNSRMSGLAKMKVYTRYLVRPEPPKAGFFGVRERQAQGAKEDVYVLFTEAGCYDVTFRGAKPIPDDLVTRYHESTLHNILYILRQRLGEPGLAIEYKGTELYDNMPANVVEIVDDDNRVVTVWFHQSTKLPLKQLYIRMDPKTHEKHEEVTIFSKFRDVSGMQWPFVVRRERDGEKIYEMFAESVEINQDIPDNLFMLPSEVPVLDKNQKK